MKPMKAISFWIAVIESKCNMKPGPYQYEFKVIMNSNSNYPKGQCTEWVDGRIFQLTGRHTLFNGDAKDWPKLAYDSWKVSSKPNKLPAIMVLQPGINGAGQYGHVAVVENYEGATVCTSNWNFDKLGKTTLLDFDIKKGVSFIYYDN